MANQTQSIDMQSSAVTVQAQKGEGFSIRWSMVGLYLILLIGVIIAIVPFYWMGAASLMTRSETTLRVLYPGHEPGAGLLGIFANFEPQWGNYLEAWQEADFSLYFQNSVIITIVTLTGQLVTAILSGYAFARIRFWGRDTLFALLLSTMMVPSMVVMIPNFRMVRGDIICLPTATELCGSWLNTLQGITVPFMVSVFAIFLLRQFFAQIPAELWDAGRIDGTGHFLFLTRIVLPISKAPIFTVLILGFISSWNDFLWPLLVTTTATWRPLMIGLWTLQSEAGPDTQLIMAGSVITIIPILILYFLTQKQFTEGIATSGLKG